MSLTVKRPTIEGMPSPAARSAGGQDATAAAPMRLDLMRSLRKRPRLAAGVGGAVFLLAFLFGLLRKPAYLAESLIYIEPLASKVLSDGTAGSYDAGRYDSYFEQQMQTAVRPDILASAIEKLPPFVWQRGGESTQSAVTRLQNSLKVQRVLTSYQLSISLVYANPQAAAAVVNAVTTAYLEQGRNDEHAVIDQRLKLLGEERQRIQQQLGEDRVEQASLGGVLGLSDPSGKAGSPFDAQIAGAQTQVAGARQARDVAAAQYASQGAGSAALTAAAEEQMATDAGLNSMKQTISQRKALLSTQMAGLTPSNPIYKQDQDEIGDLDRSLDAMTAQVREKAERRLQDKLRADLQRTADIEGRSNAELRHQTATATSSVPKLQRAQELNSDIARLTARFTVVDDAMRSLELESNGPGSAHLSVPAAVPVSPQPSKRKLILLFSLPLGCFAGLFAAVLANRMDPRIYSAPDVEQVLGFSPIGVLPARSEVSGRTMEEYTLRLAAGLQSAYRVSSAQSFVFTAASATMQTSEFVQAIARILGTLGFKALVMDASSVLNAANRTQAAGGRGGSSYRSGALVRTLDGTRQGFAAEELDRLKLKYDLLLIDAPPLLTSAETEYLVRCADATILVAESGTTVKTELYQSALLLQHLNVAGVGAVLQELRLSDAEPAFRVAIAAVERLQRGRTERLEQAAQPESVAPVAPFDEARVDGQVVEAERVAEAKRTVEEDAVTLPAVARPATDATVAAERAEQMGSEQIGSEQVIGKQQREEPVVAEQVDVRDQETAEEPDQVRPWKDLLKKRPDTVDVQEPEPVVTRVTPKMEDATRGDDVEPVIYFQDRLRPRKVAAPEVLPVEERAAVQPVLVPVSPVEVAPEVETVTTAHPASAVEAEPAGDWVEAVAMEPVAQAATSLERTVFESGAEEHREIVAEPFAESAAEYESLVKTRIEVGDGGPETVADVAEQMPQTDAPPEHEIPTEGKSALEPVMDAPASISEPEIEAAAPITRPVVRREPAPPKMGWFTLKFRGTSERVLRIIPGDEGDAYEPEEEEFPVAAPDARASRETDDAGAATAGGLEERETILMEELPGAAHGEVETSEVGATATSEVEQEALVHGSQTLPASREETEMAALTAQAIETVHQHEVEAEREAEIVASEPPVDEHEALLVSPQAWDGGREDAVAPSHVGELDGGADAVEGQDPSYEVEELETAWVEEPVMEPAVMHAAVNEVGPESSELRAESEPAVEAHTPVKLRWTVRDIHQDDLERELSKDFTETAMIAAPEAPVAAAATLLSEVRSRTAALPARDESVVQKHPSGRRSGAPVEERLAPRAASLTRRWEMLSRFDAASATRDTDAESGS